MSSSPAPRPKVRLEVTDVADAALNLAYRYGVAAVSMRRLGAQVGVEAMSLYHYVPSRAALPGLMADRSLSQLPQPDLSLPWREQLGQLLVGVYRAGVNSPAVPQVLIAELPNLGSLGAATHNGVSAAVAEDVLQLLRCSPLPPQQRLNAARALISLLIGAMTTHLPSPGPLPPIATRPLGRRSRRPAAHTASKVPAPPLTPRQHLGGEELQLSVQWLLTGATTGGPLGGPAAAHLRPQP